LVAFDIVLKMSEDSASGTPKSEKDLNGREIGPEKLPSDEELMSVPREFRGELPSAYRRRIQTIEGAAYKQRVEARTIRHPQPKLDESFAGYFTDHQQAPRDNGNSLDHEEIVSHGQQKLGEDIPKVKALLTVNKLLKKIDALKEASASGQTSGPNGQTNQSTGETK
jgi:hypothetical protein